MAAAICTAVRSGRRYCVDYSGGETWPVATGCGGAPDQQLRSPRTSGVNLRTTTTPQHGAAPQLGGGGKFNLGSGQLRRRLQP
ncbi:unnamed protein product [Cuscuta campestris]|uniref:Uncharacterized protein n=1 Tax=Cuscuta campestris TaxID=132261 RepID=A0A484N1U9_9ASTE|nr:unnamed protein product [Cuscuta campestris]